jgi:aminodeoxyfutalosine deaminase
LCYRKHSSINHKNCYSTGVERKLLEAEITYNGLGMPRLNSAVVVQETQGQKQIVAVDDAALARINFSDAILQDAGFAVSIPVVNPHTHLDLSTMPYSSGSYEDFIGAVVRHGRAGLRNLEAAQSGLQTIHQLGTRVIGDIVTKDEIMRWLLLQDIQGVAYWEVFGPDPDKAEQIFNETVEKLREFRKLERPSGMKVGLSPHTPHTVSAPLLQKITLLAKQHNFPMQIHVAENPLELAFHKDATGALFDLMRPLMGDWQPSGLSPVQYLKSLGVLETQPTLIHAVNVTEQDVRDIQNAGCVVVHCPRSNQALQCGKFPWELYAKHGVTVALGTDGLGSSPSLSVEDEAFFAASLHGEKINKQALVWSATKAGYRSLKMPVPKFVRGDSAEHLYLWKKQNAEDHPSLLPPSS